MKARELQKRLGTTRTIHARDNLICVASAYVHDLVSLNVETGNLSYKFGGIPKDEELNQIYQGLQFLNAEERSYFWEGVDTIEEPITLYYADNDGVIKTAITDSLDFPSITDDGVLIYENTHFKSKKELLDYEINNTQLGIKWLYKNRAEKYKAWEDSNKMLKEHTSKLCTLETAKCEMQMMGDWEKLDEEKEV